MPEDTTAVKRRKTKRKKARTGGNKAKPPAGVKVTCAFCKGTGKDPFGVMSHLATCQVCGGRGEVRVHPPTATCKFCKGRGVEPYSSNRLTCSACKGKGVVTAIENGVPCPECGGSGIYPLQRTMAFACAKCGGQGVVARRAPVPASRATRRRSKAT